MPADYSSPSPPTLEDLLEIFSNVDRIEADGYGREGTIGITFRFTRSKLSTSAVKYVFEYPSLIIPELVKQLSAVAEVLGFVSDMEEAYRHHDPKKSIEDAIAFIQQELNQNTSSLGTLYTKLRRDHFEATIKYLHELDRRRRDKDRTTQSAAEERNRERARRAVEEEIRRREETVRREETAKAKADAHARWQKEESERRRRRSESTSDSGYARGSEEEMMWNTFRAAGDSIFEEALRGWAAYGSGSGNSAPPPPPQGTKRRWYEILGCRAGASRDEIRAAARKASKGLHPDKNTNPADAEKFKEISEAKAEGLGGI